MHTHTHMLVGRVSSQHRKLRKFKLHFFRYGKAHRRHPEMRHGKIPNFIFGMAEPGTREGGAKRYQRFYGDVNKI